MSATTCVVTWRVDQVFAVGLLGCVLLPSRAKDFPKVVARARSVSALGVLTNRMGISFAQGKLWRCYAYVSAGLLGNGGPC